MGNEVGLIYEGDVEELNNCLFPSPMGNEVGLIPREDYISSQIISVSVPYGE